jgi:Spy/CpxP family protein refolding chaperone
MRSAQTLILAGALAFGTASAALAQDSSRNGQQPWQPFGFSQQPSQNQHARELNYNDWKGSDEAREFGRSEYSGKITNPK